MVKEVTSTTPRGNNTSPAPASKSIRFRPVRQGNLEAGVVSGWDGRLIAIVVTAELFRAVLVKKMGKFRR